jgi:hypothetical protein
MRVKGQAMIDYALALAFVAIISVAVFIGSDEGEGGQGRESLEGSIRYDWAKADNAIEKIDINKVNTQHTPGNNQTPGGNQTPGN